MKNTEGIEQATPLYLAWILAPIIVVVGIPFFLGAILVVSFGGAIFIAPLAAAAAIAGVIAAGWVGLTRGRKLLQSSIVQSTKQHSTTMSEEQPLFVSGFDEEALSYFAFVDTFAAVPQPQTVTEPNEEWLTFLSSVDIFAGLPRHQLSLLVPLLEPARFAEDSHLAVERASGHRVYLIRRGTVQLYARSRSGEITVRTAGKGESLPLATLIDGGIHFTSVRAMTPVEVLILEREELLRVCRENPEIGFHVFRATSSVLGRRYNETLQRMIGSIDQASKNRRMNLEPKHHEESRTRRTTLEEDEEHKHLQAWDAWEPEDSLDSACQRRIRSELSVLGG